MSLFQMRIRFLGHYVFQGTISSIERAIQFADKFPDQIIDKNQLQRFLGCLNYVTDFFPQLSNIIKPLHNHLKKSPPAWTNEHINIIQKIKSHVKCVRCLHISCPSTFKIVETDASDLGYGGILKQKKNQKEQIVSFALKHWNSTQQNYSTIKKEILQ